MTLWIYFVSYLSVFNMSFGSEVPEIVNRRLKHRRGRKDNSRGLVGLKRFGQNLNTTGPNLIYLIEIL